MTGIASNPPALINSGGSPPGVQYWQDFTVYELDFTQTQLTAGATVANSIQIQADSYFKWTKASFYADISGAVYTDSTRPIPQITMQVQDGGSGRVLFNQAVPITNVMGTGQLPFILPVPRIFMPRSSMQVTVANFSSASAYNLRLSFSGIKIFTGQAPPTQFG